MKTETITSDGSQTSSIKSSVFKKLFSAAIAFAAFVSSASAITISGTVYDDGNGGSISGTPISTVGGTSTTSGQQLYVYLINNSNAIVARATVASNGTYSLTGSANTNYSVSLSSLLYAVNSTNPILGLPTSYAPTAEGVTSAGDGTPDYSVAINSSTDLTIDFAVDARPIGMGVFFATAHLNSDGYVQFPDSVFTGSDLEDGTYSAGFYGRDIDLFQAAGGDLYYNGSLITFSSAASATRINNFDVGSLRFRPKAGPAHQFAFSTVDNAGVPEFVPNSIVMPGTALPVSITSFTATTKEQDNYLMWQTATELGNKGFIVERSDDGIHFRTLATIASQGREGNSSQPLNYSYLDRDANNSASATFYYRIRQTDYSGAFAYSNVIRLSNKSSNSTQLSVSPNPSSGRLNLDMAIGTEGPMDVTVLSATGNMLLSRSFDATGGRLSTSLDVSAYPAGTYYVRLASASAPAQMQQFVLLPH
jgi:hypothetical protein